MQAREGHSLEAQRARIEAWAKASGYELASVHVDAGLSGARTDNRPGLRAALKKVCELRGALVVYSLSRLARSVRETLRIADRLHRAGADLVSLSQQIDSTTPGGKLIFHIFLALDEFERDLTSERTREVKQHRKSIGKLVSIVPYGWELAGDGETLRADPEEQRAIRLAVDRHAGGASLRAIAGELERAGLRPKRGGKWHAKTIRDLIADTRRLAQ